MGGGVKRSFERVRLETDRYLIVGNVTLPPEGYRSRFSDLLNRQDVTFIPIVDVEITPLGGGEVVKHDFLVVSKAHIRLAFLLESSTTCEPPSPAATSSSSG